ncbi:MAG: ROK family protein [Endomicrobium sp.]|jgi:glucokinase|nr:ROK family protein [Endomicrobium sp.]
MAKKLYLGIDMGGTNIKIAIVNSKGLIIEETMIRTDLAQIPLKLVQDIINQASSLKNYSNTKNIGIGIAGDVDCDRGIVRFSPNIPKWKNIKLKKIIEKLTKKSVFVDNDANTAAIGAFWLDAKGKSNNLVCITLGTGVGGGLIFGKKLYRGTTCTAGEIGHITVEPGGRKCKCGNCGCVETYVGANYITQYCTDYLNMNKSKIIDEMTGKDYSKITPKVLHEAALKGDKSAVEIWKYIGGKLGILLADVLNFVNPDTIILCGGVSHAGRFLTDPAKKEMKTRAFKSAQKACKLKVSNYTSKLGVVGAAMLADQ